MGREVLDIEIEGLTAVRGQLDGGFLEALERLAACKGRVVVTGIGKSGLVGRKIAATLSSTGTAAFFLHPVEGAHGDLGMIRPGDVVLALSNSGETGELNTLLPALKSLGAVIVCMTSGVESTLARLSDVVIMVNVPREACPLNLAPTTSTTAALAVGDALAVCLMRIKDFGTKDFKRVHPAGALGARLSQPIGSLMHTENLPVAREDVPLNQALAVLNAGGFGLAALTDASGRLTGVLTDGDVRRMLCKGGFEPSRPVAEVMTKAPRNVAATDSSAQVLDLMEARQITVLPVLNQDGSLAGLVHLHDLLGKGRVRFAPV
ncbi:MAG: KpsF/GutQ family sugar-phosphate isomerase [Humidesulfovibrio sp.]|nr:KpsF/GutQ family sugar-phosphate isomerase [Humidesulfovibrio sp.]